MKKSVLLLFAIVLSFTSYSQISFESGYFIDNQGKKHEVLIKNVDWRNNPNSIEFKEANDSKIREAGIDSIREFGVYNVSKFQRASVKIDRSSDNIDKLSENSKPEFKDEILFLKILIEGKANLFQYNDGPLRRYFFNKENSEIKQLIYKRFLIPSIRIGTNNSFRQQLKNELKCGDIQLKDIENLEYNKEDLMKFFEKYNTCIDSKINFKSHQKKDLFNLSLRPRLNNSSLNIEHETTASRDTDFDNEIGFGFGIESEFIFPFSNNKWSILIEPTYQSFNHEKINTESNVQGGTLITKSNYQSIEAHFGIRHYFYINDISNLFLNVSYVWDFENKSSIEFYDEGNNSLGTLDIKTSNNFAIGGGFKLNDRYSIEIRYQTIRNLLKNKAYYHSEYQTISVIAGYSFF